MSKHQRLSIALLLAVGLSSALLLSHSVSVPQARRQSQAIALLSQAPLEGFARAIEPRQLEFPLDHGAHPRYQTEWWYFTGHLHDERQQQFGFQLTLFRFEMAAEHSKTTSPWRTPRVMMGHFAVTDISNRKFYAFERLARAVPVVAGASSAPAKVWLDDWRIEYDDGEWHLQADQEDLKLRLVLQAASSTVAQGEHGLSRKSAAAGNASYYYSIPKLIARGTLNVAGQDLQVRGTSWLDREWSTSSLDPSQRGWDWFSLQLDNGASLMFYRLRRDDGQLDAHSAGSYVTADGERFALGANDVEIKPTAYWTSPSTQITYPARWQLTVPKFAIDVAVEPRLAEQEWRGRFRYWEGAVGLHGRQGRADLTGRGYVELTGY